MKSLVEYIYEMLKSQESISLKNKIEDLCKDIIYEIELLDSSADKYKIISILFKDRKSYFKYELKIDKLCKFYKYFKTIQRKLDNGQFELVLEPEFSDSISEKIYNSYEDGGYNGIVYHITDKENTSKILKDGLKVHPGSAKIYRYFPERFFCFPGSSDEEIKANIKYILIDMFKNEKQNVDVLKIDLNKHRGLIFYTDPGSGNDKNIMLYCNVSIPAKLISVDKKYTKFANDIYSNTSKS